MLLSIQGGSNLGIFEINDAAQLVKEAAHPEANIIFGLVISPEMKDEMRVTIIATGFPEDEKRHPARHESARELASPRTEIDLETKLKAMMSSSESRVEAPRAAAQPAPQPIAQPMHQHAPQPAPRPVPSAPPSCGQTPHAKILHPGATPHARPHQDAEPSLLRQAIGYPDCPLDECARAGVLCAATV